MWYFIIGLFIGSWIGYFTFALMMMARRKEEEIDTDICSICLEEKPIDDLHRNCGK